MGNVQRTHGFNGQGKGLIAAARTTRLSQPLSCRPQDPEDLRPIEALTFTVIAEAHVLVPRVPSCANSLYIKQESFSTRWPQGEAPAPPSHATPFSLSAHNALTSTTAHTLMMAAAMKAP